MTLGGSVNREGTKKFMDEAMSKGIHPQHIRVSQGLYLTSIGMGTYLGEPNEETDKLVVEAAKESILKGAINVVDTAINYRFQRAERAVGRALKELCEEKKVERSQVFISTKSGYLTHDAAFNMDFWTYIQKNLIKPGIIKPEDISSETHCMTASYLGDQLKKSLKNLDMNCIDLIYLHNPAESQMPEIAREEFMKKLKEAFEFYEESRKNGRIRFYGLATWTCFRAAPGSHQYLNLADVVKIAKEIGGGEHGFRFIQLPYNLAMQEASSLKCQGLDGEMMSILDAAKTLGIGVFTSVPLLQGRLLRAELPRIRGLSSKAQVAIQFARSAHEAIVAPLVGQKDPRNVTDNLRLASFPPSSKEEFQGIYKDLLHGGSIS